MPHTPTLPHLSSLISHHQHALCLPFAPFIIHRRSARPQPSVPLLHHSLPLANSSTSNLPNMTSSNSLFRNQTTGLLIRSYHWHRRQYCTLVCNFILPSLFLIALALLQRYVKPPKTEIFQFQKNPKGAFAPRPFDPSICSRVAMRLGFDDAAVVCRNPFIPEYVVPVYAVDSARSLIGARDVVEPRRNTGLLSHFSLDPFIYPQAIPDNPFSSSQSPYDGVFLHALFDGNKSNELYQLFLSRANAFDNAYLTKTRPIYNRTAFFESIYNSWFRGSFFDTFSTALAFDFASQNPNGDLSIAATVFYNESTSSNCTEICPIVSNVVRTYNSIYAQLNPGKTAMTYLRRMPLTKDFNDLGFINLIISVILGLTTHFLFPSFLRFLVLERVGRMRSMMAIMGLRRRQYWLGTYLSLFVKYLIALIVQMIIGALAGIPFFTKNSPLSYLLLFFFWGNTLISQAMLLAPFFSSPETAQTVGWLFALGVNLIGGPYIGRVLSNDNTTEKTWISIMLLPSFAYMRSLYFAGALNTGGKGVTIRPQMYRDVQLGMCSGKGPFCRSFLFLSIEWLIFMILAAYFDCVLPTALGSRRHPLFFLGMERKVIETDDTRNDLSISEDVLEEESRATSIVENMQNDPFDGVVLSKLSKTYPGGKPVRALKGLSLVARKDEVLCILAHNGAGKTTAFRTLVGELSVTSGTAYVCGNSIINDMHLVHRNMGVAPQQDILWDVMSVQEHLYFYGRVKNLSGQELKDAVQEAIDSVQLNFARRRKASQLSGGMKRRLSVSIALIGKPQFIILDEPSTGLDILAREKLWEAIERMKRDRVVILTTHSLEEAETLSSRVAIMSQGELRCVGSAEDLKMRLGKGHHLNVSLPVGKVAAFHQAIMNIAPESVIETELGGNLEYVLPRVLPIPEVFKLMAEKREELEIRDWSINQATLEEVFLRVTKDSQKDALAAGKTEDP